MPDRPAFLITIDTEGDNLWSRPRTVTTRNASFLPRFQRLCERYGLKPTYLTNYEMANSPEFQEFGKDILRRHVGEIGMHLHAWDTPPPYPLTEDDSRTHPWLIKYPERVMREKVGLMTDLLEQVFGTRMLSHRAGRWAFNERYAQILISKGYRVDCSVTPHLSWGSVDYTRFPTDAYFLDPDDISRSGGSLLLEVPVTIEPCRSRLVNIVRGLLPASSLPRRALDEVAPPVRWLRPGRRNLGAMIRLLRGALRAGRRHVEFMFHSSELMPGGSPNFRTARHIEKLYADLEVLFSVAARHFRGLTLAEYYHCYQRQADRDSESDG